MAFFFRMYAGWVTPIVAIGLLQLWRGRPAQDFVWLGYLALAGLAFAIGIKMLRDIPPEF